MDANTIQAIASVVQALTGCIGVPALLFSLFLLLRQTQEMIRQSQALSEQYKQMTEQTREQTLATRATVYQNLTAMMLDIDHFFIDHLDMKPYFYNSTPIPEDPELRARVESVAEMLMDFMDFVLTHEAEVQPYPWDEWKLYFQFIYVNSPALQKFWAENTDWYMKEFKTIFANAKEDLARSGRL